MTRAVVVVAMLFAFACASVAPAPAPPPVPKAAPEPQSVSAEALVDHAGDSPETAIAVPKDAPNDGINWMMNWTYDRYGRFRRKSWAIANQQGRHYEVMVIELADHSERKVYFDITESWEAWRPDSVPAPPPHQ